VALKIGLTWSGVMARNTLYSERYQLAVTIFPHTTLLLAKNLTPSVTVVAQISS
jgi:hypothetical protein